MALLQSLSAPAQAQTDYSTNTVGTSHAFTVTGSNLTIRNSLLLVASYDGAMGDLITGITDTDGNTWAKATSATNSTQTNGELWYCTNLAGGTKPTITVATSASVKMTITVEEIVGIISYASALEAVTARVHTPGVNSLNRSTLGTGIRTGAVSVIICASAANATSLTFTNGGSGFNGTGGAFHTYKDGTSGLSVAIAHRNTEVLSLGSITGNMVVSPTSTTPVAMMVATFYRQGVSTGVAGDGALGNVEGVVTEDNTTGLVYKSSASAPLGGTGGSTDSKVYGFIPGLNLPTGVTVSAAQLNWNLMFGFYDGTSDGYSVQIDPTAPIGTTLETTDENGVGGSTVLALSLDDVVGFKTATLSPSDVSITTTYMNTMYHMDTVDITGSNWQIGLRADNTPNFVEALLTWPTSNSRSYGYIID